MNMKDAVHVSIAEVKIGQGKDVLMASLGSCVGIALIWKRKEIYGLAHCLLPETDLPLTGVNARYVSWAVPSLLQLMDVPIYKHRELEAVIAGGGNMTAPKGTDPAGLVGHMNGLAAEKILKSQKISVLHKDLGGEAGRKILLYCETGEYIIKPIPRIITDVA